MRQVVFFFDDIQPHTSNEKDFKLLWVGKYDSRKQLELALKTMYRLKDTPNIKLYVAGTGYDEDVAKYNKMV